MNRKHGVGWILASALLALACGGKEEAPAPSAPAPAPAADAPAPAPTPPAEPAPATPPAASAPEAAATTGPFACIAGSADRGKVKYQQLCATCHGATGNGDGPGAAALNPKPAHHSDGAYMNALTNDHLVQVVAKGGASVGKSAQMAPWGGVLTPDQILDVVAYVRTLATPPYGCP